MEHSWGAFFFFPPVFFYHQLSLLSRQGTATRLSHMASHISPVGDGDEKVTFPPDRPSFLPNIYIKRNHPHHKGSGRAFYYIQDGSPRGMQRVARLERNSLAVPEGGEREAIRKGMLVCPGFFVFAMTSGRKNFDRFLEVGPRGCSLR